MRTTPYVAYIAGPMTGLPEFNYPAFQEAKEWLEKEGIAVNSPHDIPFVEPNGRGSLPWETYMKAGLKLMMECDAVIFLPGWTGSHGAKIEFDLACKLNMDVFRFVPAVSHRNLPAQLETM